MVALLLLLTPVSLLRQNSCLSAKIEELNAHISSLYVENLRLRASEIALSSQLKREKEKCQKIMADAEAAVSDRIVEPTTVSLLWLRLDNELVEASRNYQAVIQHLAS